MAVNRIARFPCEARIRRTKEEMRAVSGYVDALANLRNKVREAHANNNAEDEEEPSSSTRK